MSPGFGWHCDGGVPRSLTNPFRRWECPACTRGQDRQGHRCRNCRRRICCSCFDHLDAMCRDGTAGCVAP